MRYTGRTKNKLKVSDIIATFYERTEQGMRFKTGYKPDCLPQNKVLSRRKLRSIEFKRQKQNPIIEAKRFKKFTEEHPSMPYWHIGEMFGMSKGRLSQLISLVTKLPSEISGFIEQQSDPEFLCFFTERKLRELTQLTTDTEKRDAFRQMIDRFNEKNNVLIVF